jgi:hypothetical protein
MLVCQKHKFATGGEQLRGQTGKDGFFLQLETLVLRGQKSQNINLEDKVTNLCKSTHENRGDRN